MAEALALYTGFARPLCLPVMRYGTTGSSAVRCSYFFPNSSMTSMYPFGIGGMCPVARIGKREICEQSRSSVQSAFLAYTSVWGRCPWAEGPARLLSNENSSMCTAGARALLTQPNWIQFSSGIWVSWPTFQAQRKVAYNVITIYIENKRIL